LKVHRSQSVRRAKVTTDGEGLVSHAGTALVAELADRSGLTEAMSVAMGDSGISWHTHDPGVVLTHMAVAIADGADCLSQLRVLRDQESLFGPVASHATAWRAVESVTSHELRAIEEARATARSRVWAAGGAPATVTLDFDATLVDAHSDKQYAAPTYKRGFGFHPLGVWCDETGEALAAMLRPGNAGANTAADHVKMLDAALAQLPAAWRAGHRRGDDAAEVMHPVLVRADSAGATHGFVDALVERNIGYSIGFDVDGRVRDALLLAQEEDWVPAVDADGGRRPGAWVIELTDLVDLGTWPEGARLICRRERPHPGAQLSLFDIGEGFRHTCFLTCQPSRNSLTLPSRNSLVRREEVFYSIASPSCRVRGCRSARSSRASTLALMRPSSRATTTRRAPRRSVTVQNRPADSSSLSWSTSTWTWLPAPLRDGRHEGEQ